MNVEVEAVKPVLLSRDMPDDENLDTDIIDNEEYEETGKFEGEDEEAPELSAREQIAKDFQDKNRQFGEDGSKGEPDDKKVIEDEKNTDTLETDQPKMVPVKVNGREILVEQDKIDKAGSVQAYQKEVAVMQGFKDLAYQKKELEAKEAELARREQSLLEKEQLLPTLDEAKGQTQSNSNTSDLPNGDQPQLSDLIAQHREALLDGDDEEAESLMSQMLSIRQPQTLDADELAERAAEKSLTIMAERDRNLAISHAQNELLTAHPELNTDARLYTAVDDETVRVEQEFPHYTPTQILNEAYSRVIEWRGGQQQNAADNAQKRRQDKANEKRSINRPRVATGRSQAPPAPRRQTKSEYIAALRKSRGLEI